MFSDLHLGVHQNSDKWLDVSLEWARWFRHEMEQQDIDVLLFLGDWYHYRDQIEVKTLHRSEEILNLFEKWPLHMIPGNHDSYFKDHATVNSVALFHNKNSVKIYNNPTQINLGGRSIMMCPWGTKRDDIQPSDVILGHFEIETFKMNKGKVCDHGIKAQHLIEKSPLTFSGHFHKVSQRKYDKGEITYVGNPYEMDMHDLQEDKGYWILELNTLDYKMVKNPISPNHVKIRVGDIKDINDYKYIENKIVRLVVDIDIKQAHMDKLLLELSKFKPFNVTVDYLYKFEMKKENVSFSNQLGDLSIEDSIKEYVSQSIDQKYKKDVEAKTLDIYNKVV